MQQKDEEVQIYEEKIRELLSSKFKTQSFERFNIGKGSTTRISLNFGIFGIVFLSIGVALWWMSEECYGNVIDYDVDCGKPSEPPFGPEGNQNNCVVTLDLEAEIEGNIYIYYQMHNFFQTMHGYRESRNEEQMEGHEKNKTSQLQSCAPAITNEQMDKTHSLNGTPLDPKAVAIPCGVVAKSIFNDTFELYNVYPDMSNPEVGKIHIDEKDIAWVSDRKEKFGKYQDKHIDWQETQWIDLKDEHLVIWMRTAGLSTFRKLYGVIRQDLPAGRYYFFVKNNYNVMQWSGKKSIVIANMNSFGGQNYGVALCYMVVSGICFLFTLGFAFSVVCFEQCCTH